MNNEIIFWNGIWPNAFSRSIGAYQLAYWLRKNKVESQIIDFCQWYSSEELVNLTIPFISNKTKFLGVSSTFWPEEIMPENILESIKIIKKEYPNIKIVIGGPRANSSFNKENSDLILLGEAENSLLNLIKGHNITTPFDITQLDHRFIDKDCIIEGEVLPIELGRGCIFKCKFCGHHNLGKPKHTYQRKIHLIEEEISYNYEKFKTTHYNFLDDTINEDSDKIKNLSLMHKNTGIKINWNGYLRADLIYRYPDTAYQLVESGMKSCFFGIESLHPTASKIIGKGWSGKKAKDFLPYLYETIWKKNINIWANFIIGLPNEAKKDLFFTLEWAKNNPLGHYHFANINLYNMRTDLGASSEFNKNYKNYGYNIDSNGIWKNIFMDQIEAEKLTIIFNNLLNKDNKMSSWNLFDLVNCGISLDEGKNILSKNKNLYDNIFVENFLNQYKNRLKNLQ